MEGPPLAAFDSTGLVFGITAKMAGDEGNVSCIMLASFTMSSSYHFHNLSFIYSLPTQQLFTEQHIHLFDARNYSAGPFSEMQVKRQNIESKLRATGSTPERAYALSRAEWTSIDFNKSGQQILICNNGGVAHTIDGFEGTVLHSFQAEGGSAAGGSSSLALPMSACFTSDDKSVLCGNNDGSVSCYQADSGLLARKLRGHVDRVGCVAANPKYAQIASSCTNSVVWVW